MKDLKTILEEMKLPSRDLVKVKVTEFHIKTDGTPWSPDVDAKLWYKDLDTLNISLGADIELMANIEGKPRNLKCEINAKIKYLQYGKSKNNVDVSFDIKGHRSEIFDYLWILGSNAIAMNITDSLFEKEFDAALSAELGNPPVKLDAIKKQFIDEFSSKLSREIEDKE